MWQASEISAKTIVVISAFSAVMLASCPALAEEDCFNGPVPVNGAYRGQITVPQGQAVRLTFTFNAQWENMVFVCDALTGHRILVKGNYSRDREDWLSPIDNTRSLAYYVVTFHKTVSPDAGDAGSHPWLQSPMKKGDRVTVEGQGGAYVDSYGFNDSGGDRWDNALVTAYFIGRVGTNPPPLPASTLQMVRTKAFSTFHYKGGGQLIQPKH
ncbi:MAG TPA: hypothetical protein VFB14_08960 [Bryobacteraceae bacterium]|jgi:hypothetical protein|nr:hypothetical protein [Bryobacteraceae bacterium]